MEKTGQYSGEDTRTCSDNYRVQKNTMKKVCIMDEGMLRWSKAWRGGGSKIDEKEGEKEAPSRIRN